MQQICQDKNACTGCTACVAACPKQCISMVANAEGFLYPQINQTSCIDCKRCEILCPVNRSKKEPMGLVKEAYLARLKNKADLLRVTSGGIGTAFAEYIVEQGGHAVGAIFAEDFSVKHEIIKEQAKVFELAGSKYVQSDLNQIFKEVKLDLVEGRELFFCGTPCQVEGLKAYLNKDYENLLTVELVCHGVSSPFVWKQYLDHIQKKAGKLESVVFRKKEYGYHMTTMEEVFESGHKRLSSARTNLMLKSFFSNIADRKSCYCCPFKNCKRASDITLFDAWSANKLLDFKDDDRGYTNVLIHTEKGGRYFSELAEKIDFFEISAEHAIALDGKMLLQSVSHHSQRTLFFQLISEKGFDGTMQELLPVTKKDFFLEKSKKILFKMGIAKYLKQMKDKIVKGSLNEK